MDRYFTVRGTMQTIKVMSGNKILKYSTLCRDSQAYSCEEDVVEKIMTSGKSVSLTYPETLVSDSKKNLTRIFLGTTFGGVETDHEGSIARARALAMYFRLKKNTPSPLVHQWDRAFQAELSAMAGRGRNITWWSYGGFIDAVSDSFKQLYKGIAHKLRGNCIEFVSYSQGVGYSVLVTVVLCVVATFTTSSYRSKPWAGLGVALGTVLSHVACLGILVGVSGQLNVTSFPVFYTFSGTAILLLLILLQGWRKFCNIAVHPREKLMFLFSWDAPCVVGVCAAGIGAFVIAGASTTIPYFRYILFLNAGSILFFVLFAVLFFSAVLFLTGKREAAGVKWFMFWETGDTHFPLPLTHRYNKKDLHRLQYKLADEQLGFSRSLGGALAKVHIRYVAFLVFAIYAIFAVWGCTIAPISLKEDDFLMKGSESSNFLKDYREFYGRYERYLQLSFEDVVDYMNPVYRDAILDMLDWAQEQQFATRVVSWLRDFMRFEASSIYLVNDDTFVPVVHLVYLQTDRYKQYMTDIAFDKYHGQIVSSRMYMELSQKGQYSHLELINGLLSRAKAAGLPLKIQAPSVFLLQHDVQLKPAFITSFCVLLFIFSVGGLVFFGQPFTSLIAMISTVSVAAGVIGYAALWEVPMNAPTVATVVSGLLYSTVACFTLCYHFSNSVGHYLLFLPPCLLLLVQNLPQCCEVLQELCDETCCVCCDNEEDATSIYYIPTTGRTLDREGVQQYFSKHSLRALPPPPRRDIILSPLDPHRPDIIVDDFDHHSPRVHSSGYGSLPRSYRDPRGSPPPRERDRYFCRPRSVSPSFQRAFRVVETPEPRITSPAPSVKPTRDEPEKKHKEEDIYEEPPTDSPTNSLASGSIYIVKEGKGGRNHEMKRVPSHQREAERAKEPRARDRRGSRRDHDKSKRWSREYHRPESYHAYDDYDPHVQDLRPGWKQYYLDGALRQPPGVPEMPPPRRLPRGPGAPPYPGGMPGDIPAARGSGRIRSSYPAPYRHRDHVPGPPPPYMGPRPVW